MKRTLAFLLIVVTTVTLARDLVMPAVDDDIRKFDQMVGSMASENGGKPSTVSPSGQPNDAASKRGGVGKAVVEEAKKLRVLDSASRPGGVSPTAKGIGRDSGASGGVISHPGKGQGSDSQSDSHPSKGHGKGGGKK